ncbi:putative signal peptidase II [Symbiobacterium thermophilum IAM 14863]|uniref:Putative signal peptidase II n=1 Tax=Symbiobacterium thermophilum (strain DSM 24528 / JCM 14929 / IAM 14863 / T) TaxID=292459 RepID=Q67JB3_SYMTH|nr:putative signal peptidase II [Symbiobacterium thermophilum IAM 14863]
MVCVVGVRFKLAGKVYYFDPGELPVAQGDRVIVETVRGVEYGEVVVGPKMVPEDEVVQPLKKVIRIGNDRDAQIAEANKRKEKDAFAIALQKIEAHNLDMYLVDVEYTFDGSKIIFYFTAEGRVDFRELVRDLASVFRTRIEMRQIGVRDEAKLLGGIGPCGRVLCCTSFLGEFAPVSIRMAKDQNLSLNPSKISGLCGRLMCCLRFEQETYEAAKKDPTLAPAYVPPPLPDPEPEEMPEVEWLTEPAAPVPAEAVQPGAGDRARIAGAREDERPSRRERGRNRGEGTQEGNAVAQDETAEAGSAGGERKSRRRARRRSKRQQPRVDDSRQERSQAGGNREEQGRAEAGRGDHGRRDGSQAGEQSRRRGHGAREGGEPHGEAASAERPARSAHRRRRRRRPAAAVGGAAGGTASDGGAPAAGEAGG